MIIPETDLTPLDPRFPIAMTGTIPLFGALLAGWEDRITVISQARRAAEQAARREERFVTPAPRFVPAQHHEDTVVDFRLTDGDRFPSEGEVRPEDTARWQAQRDAATGRTEHLGVLRPPESPRVMEREIRAAERRRPLRRAWRWLRGT